MSALKLALLLDLSADLDGPDPGRAARHGWPARGLAVAVTKAERTTRKPAGEHTRDGHSRGGERVGEVALRPRV